MVDALATATMGLTTDQLIDLMQHQHRRVAIDYLADYQNDVVTVRDLVNYIEAKENDPRKQIEVELKHSHLNKMDNYGLIDYDRSSDLLEVAEPVDEIGEVLEAIDEVTE